MELGLDLKITKTRHDLTSIVSEFHFAQDRIAEHVFFSKETDTNFILNAQLKGYKRRNIEMKISEDGSELYVSGEKAVQEITMMPLKLIKKDKEEAKMKMREFIKMFKIPEGVILDGIEARYDEDECMLTIVMPKMAKGLAEEEDPSDQLVNEKKEEFEEEVEGQVVMRKKKKLEKQRRPCFPVMVGGSAFILSLVLIAIRFIRFRHKSQMSN